MELAVQINGLKFLFNTLVKSLTGETTLEKIHPELNQMVENLEITVRDEIPFNIGAFAKISDDIQHALEAMPFKAVVPSDSWELLHLPPHLKDPLRCVLLERGIT